MSSESRSRGKRGFDHIYNCADPRPYFTTLRPLHYCIHHTAVPFFRRCATHLALRRNLRRITMVDVCAGYGINAALLRHDVSLDGLYELYDESAVPAAADPEALKASDRRFFASRRLKRSPIEKVVGIDSAARAVRYAQDVGLLHYGACENLERDPPSTGLCEHLAKISLITVTGGMGYIGPQTFEHLLANVRMRQMPWIAAFPLLTTPLEPFRDLFDRFGLHTEIWEAETFAQRRYADEEELRVMAINHARMGLPSPRPGDDLQARLVLARPPSDAAALPLRGLLSLPSSEAARARNAASYVA